MNRGQRSYSIPISAIAMANGRAMEEVQQAVEENGNVGGVGVGGGGGVEAGTGGEETEMPLLPRSKS